jgi:hypothetical protein
LCATCGIPGEVVVEHTFAGNRLNEFDEGTSVITIIN